MKRIESVVFMVLVAVGCAAPGDGGSHAGGHDSHPTEGKADVSGLDTAPPTGRPAVHNWVAFGTERLYLSHLPLFHHSHHGFQVIVEARLESVAGETVDGAGAPVEDAQAAFVARPEPNDLYTIGPTAAFHLVDMFRPLRDGTEVSFRANVFRGHVEHVGRPHPRTGRLLYRNVRVVATRLIEFRALGHDGERAEHNEYILVGSGTETFAVHRITAPPDFDHIVAVTLPDGLIGDAALQSGLARFRTGRPLPTRAELEEDAQTMSTTRAWAPLLDLEAIDGEIVVQARAEFDALTYRDFPPDLLD
jgi:hypothetical protein